MILIYRLYLSFFPYFAIFHFIIFCFMIPSSFFIILEIIIKVQVINVRILIFIKQKFRTQSDFLSSFLFSYMLSGCLIVRFIPSINILKACFLTINLFFYLFSPLSTTLNLWRGAASSTLLSCSRRFNIIHRWLSCFCCFFN